MSSMLSADAALPLSRPQFLSRTSLRSELARYVRSRVPPGEVDDIVQAALTEALAAERAPEDPEQLERWVFGIVRHKCADFYRRSGREAPFVDDIPADSGAHGAEEWLRWAKRELPAGEQAESTLEWMLREAGGDQLESIAAEEAIPAPRVRQRVARLRKHFRSRWAAQLAAVLAALGLVAGAAAYWRARQKGTELIAAEHPPSARQKAAELRREGLAFCQQGQWRRCLGQLDEARVLDPEGEAADSVRRARAAAAAGTQPSRGRGVEDPGNLSPRSSPEPTDPVPSPKEAPSARSEPIPHAEPSARIRLPEKPRPVQAPRPSQTKNTSWPSESKGDSAAALLGESEEDWAQKVQKASPKNEK